jgi:hypothetical protein
MRVAAAAEFWPRRSKEHAAAKGKFYAQIYEHPMTGWLTAAVSKAMAHAAGLGLLSRPLSHSVSGEVAP